jgi:glutathione S-transferase
MTAERTLHHFPLDPYSRQARLALGEKKLAFDELVERYWERPERLERLNPTGLTPVLVDRVEGGEVVVCESRAVLEYLEEQYRDRPLLPATPPERAEVRRIQQWFDRKFDFEVNGFLLHEKMEKRLLRIGAPELAALRRGREALRAHLEYFEKLLGERDWLACDQLTLADFSAAGHLSVLDYLGEVSWDKFPGVKTWYMKLKSRPCFRPLLADKLPAIAPAEHYDNLDF